MASATFTPCFRFLFWVHGWSVTWKLRNKRKLLVFFLRTLVDQHVAMELKVAALRLVITPMLISTFTEENKRVKPLAPQAKSELEASCVIDPEMLGLFMRSALDTANRQTRNYSEALRVELLKLTTILIEYLGQELVEHRKDIRLGCLMHSSADRLANRHVCPSHRIHHRTSDGHVCPCCCSHDVVWHI